MSDVEVGRWENELLKISVWIIRVGKEFYIFGNELALANEYKDPKKAVQENVTDPDEKKTMEEILGVNYRVILERSLKSSRGIAPRPDFFRRIQKGQKLLTEFGIYSFCTKSRMGKAKPFQKWIYKAIREIRETGSYTLPGGAASNPLDLIAKVSNLEKEIKTLKKETKTCDKGTQTRRSVMVVKDSFKELEDKIEKSLKKTKSSLKKSIKEAKFDLEKSIKEAKFDLEKSIKEAKFDLEKSLKEISPSSSRSSSYSSPSSRRHSSSSDSE